jgi:DNA-binding winged helix-turn-helix (wHTH) protein
MASNEVYVFGAHCLTASQRRLERDGSPVKLGAREMDLLIHLVEHAGEVLSKEDLIAVAWPGRVVEEANLRVQLAALRRTLGGGGDTDARYIVNVPMRGYSFTARVSNASSTDHAVAAAAHGEPIARNPLPTRVTHLIGRDEAMQAIVDSVRAHRLVTVVGPGGIG